MAVTPSCVFSRGSGVAPLGVDLDMSATTSTVTNRPWIDLGIRVDWKDGSVENFIYGQQRAKDKSFRIFCGHTYREAGSYTPEIQFTEPGSDTVVATYNATTITVDDKYAGYSTVICANPEGDNDFSGKPAGALEVNLDYVNGLQNWLVDQANHAINDTSVNVDSGKGTIVAGMRFNVDGDSTEYTVSSVAGPTVNYSPAAVTAFADNAAITFVDNLQALVANDTLILQKSAGTYSNSDQSTPTVGYNGIDFNGITKCGIGIYGGTQYAVWDGWNVDHSPMSSSSKAIGATGVDYGGSTDCRVQGVHLKGYDGVNHDNDSINDGFNVDNSAHALILDCSANGVMTRAIDAASDINSFTDLYVENYNCEPSTHSLLVSPLGYYGFLGGGRRAYFIDVFWDNLGVTDRPYRSAGAEKHYFLCSEFRKPAPSRECWRGWSEQGSGGNPGPGGEHFYAEGCIFEGSQEIGGNGPTIDLMSSDGNHQARYVNFNDNLIIAAPATTHIVRVGIPDISVSNCLISGRGLTASNCRFFDHRKRNVNDDDTDGGRFNNNLLFCPESIGDVIVLWHDGHHTEAIELMNNVLLTPNTSGTKNWVVTEERSPTIGTGSGTVDQGSPNSNYDASSVAIADMLMSGDPQTFSDFEFNYTNPNFPNTDIESPADAQIVALFRALDPTKTRSQLINPDRGPHQRVSQGGGQPPSATKFLIGIK